MAAPLALIVEDDAEIARFFGFVLATAGCQVETFHNGRAALDRLSAVVPRLVVLDLNIPGQSGVVVARHMRADDRLANVPLIVVTANPQMTDEVYDYADLVLIKPVSYDQLHDLVRRFV